MPKLARRYPMVPRQSVLETPQDRAFNVAHKAYEAKLTDLREATATCLLATARQMRGVLHHFDTSDPDLRSFHEALDRGIAASDLAAIHKAVKDLLATIDRSAIPFHDEQSAEAAFVVSLDNYADAYESWHSNDHDLSHRITVMCRASLNRLGD